MLLLLRKQNVSGSDAVHPDAVGSIVECVGLAHADYGIGCGEDRVGRGGEGESERGGVGDDVDDAAARVVSAGAVRGRTGLFEELAQGGTLD